MVEWKYLGEVANLVRGRVISKDYIRDFEGEYPVYSSQTANDGVLGYINSYMFDGNYLTWTTDGAYAGTIFRRKGKFSITNVCGLIDITYRNIQQDFLYFWLSKTAKGYVLEGMGNPKLMSNVASTILIPIPSLEEQTRIVGILDTFTSAIDNLKAQIAQRRKQYEFYRDQLLDLEGKEDKDIHSWGEFCKMEKGNGVQKADFVDEGIGCIHYGQIYTHYGPYTYETNKYVSKETFEKAKKASKGDIIMTDTSENVEDICKSVAWLGEEDIAVSNHALIIKHSQDPKFLSFSTETNSFFNQKRKVVVGVKVSGIKPEHLAQIKIFLPSLQEQHRIVSILDTFESSIQNLEAQLKQREQQYEYYRNKLLTFE